MLQDLKNIYHLFQAMLANIIYGFPSRHIKVIGVTGTDGKTTTTHLLYHVLSKNSKSVSMLSTVYGKVGDDVYDTGLHVTTPDPFQVQKMIYEAVLHGDEYFILETTSHAIDQNRTWGITYEGAILTNITHEHLDYHKTIDRYARTKFSLVQGAYTAVINMDDEITRATVATYPHLLHRNVKTYALNQDADYRIDFRKDIAHLADFNAYNYLAVYAMCSELGLTDTQIRNAFPTFTLPPGRIDVVYNRAFKVIIDFAHTPNGIYRILETIKRQDLSQKGNLIHVFGSAGLRDQSKRVKMGEASATFADTTILTEEDYRTEDPWVICDQIGVGLKHMHKNYSIIINRKDAIAKALSLAKPGDVVVITGKGHEKSLCRGTREFPWNDGECVRGLLSV